MIENYWAMVPPDAFRYSSYLAVMLVLFLLFGPFRARILRSKTSVEPVSLSGGKSLVVLIHGTFARSAKWTRRDHLFCSNIDVSLGHCDIYRLLWSGDNCQTERKFAANYLTKWLAENHAYSQIYLIGHSHGGAVAALAATHSNLDVLRVVTLSTPFINVQMRHASFFPRRNGAHGLEDEKLLLLGACIYGLFGVLLLAKLYSILLITGMSLLALWFLVAIFGVQPAVETALEKAVAYLRARGERISTEATIRMRPNSMLILRTPGDEASGLLAASQIASWLLVSLLRIFGRLGSVVVWFEEFARRRLKWLNSFGISAAVVVFAIFGGTVITALLISLLFRMYSVDLSAWVMLLLMSPIPLFPLLVLRVPSLVLAPALTLLSAAVNLIVTLPFGLDLAAQSSIVTVSAETTPLGTWSLTVISGGNSFLTHSYLYDSPSLFYAIARFHEAQSYGKLLKI